MNYFHIFLIFSGSSTMVKLVNESPLFAADQEFMNLFYNKKPTDCILYSEYGIPFQIHREILSQTELMQNLLTSVKGSCCQDLEIICPCSKIELAYVVKFLYEGQLHCDSSCDMSNILKILTKVFGFPEKFLGEWQEEFEITENDFDKPTEEIIGNSAPTEILSENTAVNLIEQNSKENDITNNKIFDVDFNIDIKNEVDLDSVEKGLSNPIIIPLKTKKFKSNNVKQMSQSVKPFKCENCDAGFMKKINLKRHIKVIHEEVKPYNCGTCDANFTFKGNMKKHVATVHEGQKQNLNEINTKLEEASYEGEEFSLTDKGMSKPKMTLAKLISEALLNSSDGMLKNSDICKSISTRHPYYQMNVSRWQNSVSVALSLNKSFIKSTDKKCCWKLSENIPKSLKKLKKKRFQCSYCDVSYAKEENLKAHFSTVHEGKKAQSQVKKKIATVHEGKKLCKCKYCNSVFFKKSDLFKHIHEMHEGEEPYSCGTCDAGFTFKASLKRHIATVHEGKKPHKCSFCDRCFTDKRNLNYHISKCHRDRLSLV